VPCVIERKPALFDFGVGTWLYGTVPKDGSARLTVPPNGKWRIDTFRTADPAPSAGSSYAERSPRQPRFEGWGQVIDGEQGGRAVAFCSPEFARPARGGDQVVGVSGDGTVSLEWPPTREPRVRLRALFHFVGDPVHVTAASGPLSMLHPLEVRLPSGWYSRCRLTSAEVPWP
jgi:hypothetical protein